MTKGTVLAFLALALAVSLLSAEEKKQGSFTIGVDVNLLVVPVVVVGDNGRIESDLNKDNFSVRICASDFDAKSGKKSKKRADQQPCIDPDIFDEEVMPPGRFLFKFDESGSAKEYLEKFSKPAVVRMVTKLVSQENSGIVKSQNKYMLGSFYETQRDLVSPWSQDVGRAENAVKTVSSGGNSAIFDTIYLAAKREMLPIGGYTKILILITDGMDTFRSHIYDSETNDVCPEEKRGSRGPSSCRQLDADDVIYALQEAQTVLYVIDSRPNQEKVASSFQPPLNTAEDLGKIARLSGGERFSVKSTKEADRAAESILERIGKRHLFGFYTNSLPCGWYDVKVAVGEKNKNGFFRINKRLTENSWHPERWWICADKARGETQK